MRFYVLSFFVFWVLGKKQKHWGKRMFPDAQNLLFPFVTHPLAHGYHRHGAQSGKMLSDLTVYIFRWEPRLGYTISGVLTVSTPRK